MAGLIFTLFPNLPIELRLTIWGFTPVLPRVVEIKNYGDCDQYSKCPLPSVLTACKESRGQVLKRYAEIRGGKQTILINLSIDTLFISVPSEFFIDFVGLKLRNLAIDAWYLENAMDDNDIGFLHRLSTLRTVETITIVFCTMANDSHTGDERLVLPATTLELAETEDAWTSVINFFSTGQKVIADWKPTLVCGVVKRSIESEWATNKTRQQVLS